MSTHEINEQINQFKNEIDSNFYDLTIEEKAKAFDKMINMCAFFYSYDEVPLDRKTFIQLIKSSLES